MEKRILALVFLGGLWAVAVVAQEAKRDTIKMEITATNPKDKSQKLTIREPVPAGLTERGDITVPPGLEVQFDSKTSLFYIVAEEREVDGKMERTIDLGPRVVDRTYIVELKDVWYIKENEMTGLEKQAKIAMGILERSEYKEEARAIADGIAKNFSDIRTFQTDDSIDRKAYIAGYWNSKEKLEWARESIREMERYIKLQQESVNVLEAEDEIIPSKTATWLVIFIILVFLGILTGAFYFVWQRRAHLLEGPLSEAQQAAFPESGPGSGEEEEGA